MLLMDNAMIVVNFVGLVLQVGYTLLFYKYATAKVYVELNQYDGQ